MNSFYPKAQEETIDMKTLDSIELGQSDNQFCNNGFDYTCKEITPIRRRTSSIGSLEELPIGYNAKIVSTKCNKNEKRTSKESIQQERGYIRKLISVLNW